MTSDQEKVLEAANEILNYVYGQNEIYEDPCSEIKARVCEIIETKLGLVLKIEKEVLVDLAVITSPRILMDKGVWMEACDLLGLNSWAVNEGFMDSHEKILLTNSQAKKLGLLE